MSKAKMQCGLEGWFRVVHKDKSGAVKFDNEFKNLITDEGLNTVATRNFSSALGSCVLLADNTVPTVGETALDTDWGFRSTNTETYVDVGGEDYRALLRHVFDFGPSAGAFNFSSVGVGYYTTNANNRRLFSRALILDENDNPTTLSILEGDYVQVTYRLYLYPSLDDVTGTITLDGDIGGQYDYIIRPANVAQFGTDTGVGSDVGTDSRLSFSSTFAAGAQTACYTGDIGPVDGFPSGTSNTTSTDTSTSGFTYVEDSFTYRRSFRRGLRSNPINIRTALCRLGPFCYQTQFDPPIPKTTADILDLTYEVSWARR